MGIFAKRSKYGAKRTGCALGHRHPSRLESDYCATLQLLVKSGDIKSFEYEKKYDMIVNGKRICGHKPDFTVIRKDGMVEVHETKGFSTDTWIIRRKLFEACYPEIPYIVVR